MRTDTERRAAITAREVTDDEVAFYEEHGWVKLEGFISPVLAAELLAVARKIENDKEGQSGGDPREVYREIRQEPFFSFSHSKAVGRAVHRLMNFGRFTDKTIGVRYWYDGLAPRKDPANSTDFGEVGFHQDIQDSHFIDRTGGGLHIWLALEEVTPEQGSMQFFDKSHHLGALGMLGTENSLLERYEKLPEHYELTPQIHYEAGDATVHHLATVHGSPNNLTSGRRGCANILAYSSEDSVIAERSGGVSYPLERRPIIYP